MIDMTDNNESRKTFITNVLLDSTGDNYYIVYADGSVKKNKFAIEKYNEVLLQMEEEYYVFKKNFLERKNKDLLYNSLKAIATDLLTAIGIVISYNLIDESLLRITICFFMAIIGILIHQKFNRQVHEADLELGEIVLMEEIIKRKEEFAVPVTDPETGELRKWYVVNLSNTYSINSNSSLNKYTKEETKLKKIPKFLKRTGELKDVR